MARPPTSCHLYPRSPLPGRWIIVALLWFPSMTGASRGQGGRLPEPPRELTAHIRQVSSWFSWESGRQEPRAWLTAPSSVLINSPNTVSPWLSWGSLTPKRIPFPDFMLGKYLWVPVFHRWFTTHLCYWREGGRDMCGTGAEQPITVHVWWGIFNQKKDGLSTRQQDLTCNYVCAPAARPICKIHRCKPWVQRQPFKSPSSRFASGSCQSRKAAFREEKLWEKLIQDFLLTLGCASFIQGELSPWRNYKSFSGSFLRLVSCSPARHKWGEECLFCACVFEQLTPCWFIHLLWASHLDTGHPCASASFCISFQAHHQTTPLRLQTPPPEASVPPAPSLSSSLLPSRDEPTHNLTLKAMSSLPHTHSLLSHLFEPQLYFVPLCHFDHSYHVLRRPVYLSQPR